MSFISRIFGSGGKAAAEPETGPAPECAHATLIPKWDSAEDMGKPDKITHYSCEGCGETLSPIEAERLRAQGPL